MSGSSVYPNPLSTSTEQQVQPLSLTIFVYPLISYFPVKTPTAARVPWKAAVCHEKTQIRW